MAQHDYIISNQTFPNTRADINSVLSAISTNNSGTSAPTTQYAGQFWIDTTSSTWTMYIHDGSDDIAFATIDTSANTVNFTDSALDVVTDTTPQLGGNLDLNSNDITGTGNINITGTGTFSGDLTVDTETLYVDSSNNRVGILTTSPQAELEVSGSNTASLRLNGNPANTADAVLGQIEQYNRDSSADQPGVVANILFKSYSGGGAGGYMTFGTHDTSEGGEGSAPVERMKIDGNGNVGIGTSSPVTPLNVIGGSDLGIEVSDTSGNGVITIKGNATTGGSYLQFGDTDDDNVGRIYYTHDDNAMKFNTSDAERMRIDSSGNVLLGNTSGASTDTGHIFNPIGLVFHVRDGGVPLVVDRQTSDGDIINVRKDGTVVGSIGSRVSRLYIGSGDTFITLSGDLDTVYPANSDGSGRDNAMDIGTSSGRFKDLYLGGGLYVGGTGTANKLDDYEEGTWTPTLSYTGGQTATLSENGGIYTKVGRVVTVHMEVDVSNTNSGTGSVIIGGLPFSVANLLSPTGNEATGSVGYFTGFSTAVNSLIVDAQQSSTNLNLRGLTNSTATSSSTITASIMGTGEIRASITYFTT